jgi:hypothetical protein
LGGLQLETSKKGCQANLGWPIGNPANVELARVEPFLDLRSHGQFPEAVVFERDYVNLSATTVTPCRNGFCAPNDEQRFGFNSDPCCLRGQRLLRSVDLRCPGPIARMLLE